MNGISRSSARIRRASIAVLLMIALSFGTVFASAETKTGQQGASVSSESTVSHVIKKGKHYYYKDPSTGKIRKNKGFVKDNGSLYYIGKKGRIVTGKSFKVKKKRYRAYKSGKIATGVYKWKKKRYYSDPSTGQWIKKESIVTWKGNKYYIRNDGTVAVSDAFGFKNVPYKADSSGKLKKLAIPDNGNVVTNVAKKQVGVMTGKKYWKWYFHTKFLDTDATPWCGAFVAWCFDKAGVYKKLKGVKKYGNLGYVPSYSKYADRKSKWVKKKSARGGDIVIFAGSVHVGIVEGISDGCLITIEGNAGPTSLIRGEPGAVVRKAFPLDSWKIKGIMRVF